MPISLSALRAYLIADVQDHPLPTPQPVDLATDVIPYGSTVRFEIDVTSAEPVLPLDFEFSATGVGGSVIMFPSGTGKTFAAEVRMPWGILAYAAMDGPTAPLSLPLKAWPPAGGADYTFRVREHGESQLMTTPAQLKGWPQFPGGQYTLRATPWSVAGAVGGETAPVFQTAIQIGNPPSKGGAVPKIVHLDSGVNTGSVLFGQPWLMTATVEDADNDVVAVVFTSVLGARARLALMKDDGSCGDQQPYDRVYSFLRVGGDAWDGAGWVGSEAVPVSVAAQAVDLRGNWSQPVMLKYQLRYDQFPLWSAESAVNAPNIVEVGIGRKEGLPNFPRVWARCDRPDAWVCAAVMSHPEETGVAFDDGKGPDAVAGDGIFSGFAWFTPEFWFTRQLEWDCVFYAVPKVGPPKIGQRMSVHLPAAL